MRARKRSARRQNRRGFGWIPDLPDHRDFVYAAPRAMVRRLPHRVDLRRLCPAIYDQGDLGSCTANAVAAAVQFDLLRKNAARAFAPSRLFIYYNERVIEGTVAEDSGATLRDGVKTVARQGDCPESEWPYRITKFATRPPTRCYRDAIHHRAVGYQRLSRTLSQMKGCLASGFPFVFGFTVYESFMSRAVARTGRAPMPGPREPGPDGGPPSGHAVTAVGYDDARHRFFVRNSWGTSWGMAGYFTMPYDYLLDENLADDFWTIRVVE
jgi:C1A family cysteine protease